MSLGNGSFTYFLHIILVPLEPALFEPQLSQTTAALPHNPAQGKAGKVVYRRATGLSHSPSAIFGMIYCQSSIGTWKDKALISSPLMYEEQQSFSQALCSSLSLPNKHYFSINLLNCVRHPFILFVIISYSLCSYHLPGLTPSASYEFNLTFTMRLQGR